MRCRVRGGQGADHTTSPACPAFVRTGSAQLPIRRPRSGCVRVETVVAASAAARAGVDQVAQAVP